MLRADEARKLAHSNITLNKLSAAIESAARKGETKLVQAISKEDSGVVDILTRWGYHITADFTGSGGAVLLSISWE